MENIYRGWDPEEGGFIYSDQRYDNAYFIFEERTLKAYAFRHMISEKYPDSNSRYELDPVEMFTGKRDIMNMMIFENDRIEANIIEFSVATMGTVIFSGTHHAWANENDAGETLLFKLDRLEIIGNIHK